MTPVVAAGTSWSFRRVRVAALVTLAVFLASVVAVATPDRATPAERMVQVIVRSLSGDAEGAVQRHGGTVVEDLDIVDGVSASVPAANVPALASEPGTLVTPDARVDLKSLKPRGEDAVGAATLAHVAKVVNATGADNGNGVGVALLDTGVADLEPLEDTYRGPAVGGGSSLDGYGHGTHLAGIIDSDDEGLARKADLVSVKASADDGSTSLLAVIAGLEWVLDQHDDLDIRVINISLGVEPMDDYRDDVLALAVERLWDAGVVVVAAAGNEGEDGITSPAYDPYVIAVGSLDTKSTDTLADDTVHEFSPAGTETRPVDVVAPGQSIVSLRAPGSVSDVEYPSARVGENHIKGTGTSQASAVVSAVAAGLIAKNPDLTPDEVKWILKASATPIDAANAGAGLVNLKAAQKQKLPAGGVEQEWPKATATEPETPDGEPPVPIPPPGEDDDYCEVDIDDLAAPPAPPDPDDETPCGWTGGSWTGGSWTGGSWTGGSWTGGSWTGGSWTGGSWTGGSWTGGSWTVGTWTGGSWTGGSWTGGSWTGGSWTGGSWTGGSWTGGSWTGGSWTGGSWTGGSWTGGSWTGGSWTGGSWTGGSWTGGSWTGGSWTGDAWTGGTWS